MASDSLLNVIAGLVKREGRIAKEDAKKAKEAIKAKAEQDDEEEDEDEAPVGDQDNPEVEHTHDDGTTHSHVDGDKKHTHEQEDEEEPEAEPKPEAEPEDDGEGDSKPSGPDPTLVAQVAAIVKKEIEDEAKEKKETEIKLSGKKEKIDTKPKMEQRMGRMNFKEAIRRSVTGTHLTEGYEQVVLGILEDEAIKGPLGYEPFFEKGKLFVMKGQERNAQKALKNSGDINKIPKIVGEEMEAEEYLAMEAVDVDGRCKGFKEALRRLTYEKIRQIKEKEKAKIDEMKSGTGYELYHKDFSSAMQHAYDHAKKKGFVVDPGEIDDKVATGPKKPSSGKTNRYILGTDKKKNVHVQVTNLDNKRYELNMYIEEVEPVDEGKGIGNFNTDPKKIKKEYEDNEDINHHTENYLLLAVHFGTNTQVKKVKEIMKRNEKQGSTSQKDNDWMYKNIMPYYDKIRNEEVELGESIALQIVMALDDVGIVATEITDNEVTVKKKEVKKAEAALKKSFKGKKVPKVIGEKFTISAFDKIKGIRNRLNEGIDRVAAVELKTYIENDSDLYRQQIVPIIKNVQRKMKSGKYDHTKAPKLWMYLIDNGAKKYVKEFGGNVKDMFPKDLRMSVANEFANEYRAEIEIQGGEMV